MRKKIENKINHGTPDFGAGWQKKQHQPDKNKDYTVYSANFKLGNAKDNAPGVVLPPDVPEQCL
ncbi:hypothetical protein LJC48_02195 [Desulfovibrio sp. OttesenSCG-928-C06]|nr:hypothetical protein [Desulfovibrio sp. OttesenSCG-928-C06]